MGKSLKRLLVATLVMTMASCTVYHPQAVDIPLINHEEDLRVDASLGMSFLLFPDIFTYNMTASYGFNKWFAGQLHANYGGESHYVQLAPGAYLPLGDHAVLEGYAGIGFGGNSRSNISDEIRYNDTTSTGHNYNLESRYIIPFAQANFGWHDLGFANLDLGFGLKVGGYIPNLNYYETYNNGDLIDGSEEVYTKPNILVEPQMMLRLGNGNLKFNLKVGYSWLSDVLEGSHHFAYDDVTVSLGVTFSL